MEPADVILKHWEDQRQAGRQAEEQRAKLTNMLLVISAAGLGFIAQQGLRFPMLLVTIPLAFVGLYGAVASEKLYERFNWHNKHAKELSLVLMALVPGLDLDEPMGRAARGIRIKYPIFNRIRLHWIWTSLHLALAATGVFLTMIILCR